MTGRHPTLKTLNWKLELKNLANKYQLNFNLKKPNLTPHLEYIPNIKSVEVYTDASLDGNIGGGAVISRMDNTTKKTSHSLEFPANSTNLEIQTAVIALLENRRRHVTIYSDSLNTVRWINLFAKGETKKYHSRSLKKLEFLIQIRRENSLQTQAFHIFSHLLENTEKASRKMKQMKDMYGLDLPRILKYNQMADKLAGNVKKALKLSPFDEFSPIVYFNKQTEPTTYQALASFCPTFEMEKRKHFQLIYNPSVNWSLYKQLYSNHKYITIRAASSGLWTRARIFQAFPDSIKITDNLCPLCKTKADHSHIFETCLAIETPMNILPCQNLTREIAVQRGLPEYQTTLQEAQTKAQDILNKWNLHCLISWNNIQTRQELLQDKRWKRIINGPKSKKPNK